MAKYLSGLKVISKKYRVCPEKRIVMIDNIRKYMIGNFKNVHNYGDMNNGQDNFKFKYHGRNYIVTLKDESNVVKTGGFPQTVAEGLVELVIKFPNENKSNRRLVSRLDREVNLPFIGIDMDGF